MTPPIREQIKTRGYWRVRISPELFDPRRVAEIGSLKTIVRDLAVEIGSLSFPSLDYGPLIIGNDWIEHENEAGDILQYWRFYQSAQLVLFEGFIDDWLDRSGFGHSPTWQPQTELSVSDVLTTYWQAYEFAARLAKGVEGKDPIKVSVSANGLRGRRLKYEFRNRARLHRPRIASVEGFDVSLSLSRESLLSSTTEHVVKAAHELFARFDWDVDTSMLETLLDESGVRFARPAS